MNTRNLEGTLAEEQLNSDFLTPGSKFYGAMQDALAADKAENKARPADASLKYGEPYAHSDSHADGVVNQFLGGGEFNLPYPTDP
jgi:hypothetical protein